MAKSLRFICIVGLLSLLLGCSSLGRGGTQITDVPLAPTLASLVGTWQQIYSGETSTNTSTLRVTASGSFIEQTLSVNSGSRTSYAGLEGTITTSGYTVTITETKNYSGSKPITSSTRWQSISPASFITASAIEVNGKYYLPLGGLLYIAKGTPSGLVGTWEGAYSSSGVTAYTNHQWSVLTFNSGGACTSSIYSSPSNTMPNSPSYPPTTGTYSVSNGVMSTSGSRYSFVIYVSYLYIMLDGTSSNAGAWVKQ